MFKRDWTTSSNINNYSTIDSEQNWLEGPVYPIKKSANKHFQQSWTCHHTRSDFSSDFCRCFIIIILDLLMRHKCLMCNSNWWKWENMEKQIIQHPHHLGDKGFPCLAFHTSDCIRMYNLELVGPVTNNDRWYFWAYNPPSINVTPISVNLLLMLTFFYSPHIAHYKC